MARHEQPDKLEKPLCTYICNCDHFPFAIKSAKLLENFKENLKVWWTQYPSSREYTCWYVGFNHKEQPFILNINIRPNRLELEFRYPQFISREFKLTPSPNKDWGCADTRNYSENQLQNILKIYVNKIRKDFDTDKLKYRKWHPRKTKNKFSPINLKCTFS